MQPSISQPAGRIGWAILGCGDITDKRGAPAINAQEQSRLVAFHSRSEPLAAEFARRHGAPRWTTDRAELLADPEVTAVYVATEHHRHCEDVLAAAEAGKHVLCEKPVALSVEEGRRMIDACRRNGVALQVAYYRRYYPKMLRMKELLDAGAIGEPVTAHIHLSDRLTPDRITPRNWRLDASRSGGGQLVDTGSHRLDLLCWLLGEPESVAAFVQQREMPIQAPDTESLLIRMACGAHVTTHHGFRTSSGDLFEFTGTEGTLSASPVDG
ncbi:MAG TPA: Gfo/Idh/MocA family oxidoreductase, partial [Armatimonadota bacterium]|nr:Gfo/Idh/MocA family oxidoreductase [Armatimonadota bacterium]